MDRFTQLYYTRASRQSPGAEPGRSPGLALDQRTRPELQLVAPETPGPEAAVGAASRFTDLLGELDRVARRQHRTVPTQPERLAVDAAFWEELIPVLAGVEANLGESDLSRARRDVQTVLHPWLLRSRLWARSWLKPHGNAGDYRMLEWMYDLECDACADPHQPAAVNLLDGLYKSVHSVQAVWHRRAWFANVIGSQVQAARAPVRALDVACGGSRYVQDVIERHGPKSVAGTFFDQDPAALSFVRSRLPEAARTAATIVCAPVSRLDERMRRLSGEGHEFDVVISTGLFDYLAREPARQLLAHMISFTRPGGTVAVCNFSPGDASRVVKDWIADWRLIYRTAPEMVQLFPPGMEPAMSGSPDGGLLYAHLVKPTASGDHHEQL